MPETLEEFIKRSLSELEKAEKPLRDKLLDITVERKKLQLAAAAAGIRLFSPAQDVLPMSTSLDAPTVNPVGRSTARSVTLKEATIAVLKDQPSGLPTQEILTAINFRFATDYPRTSLSPQISRLANDRIIQKISKNWVLIDQRPEKNEAADDLISRSASAASEQEPAPTQGGEVRPGGGT